MRLCQPLRHPLQRLPVALNRTSANAHLGEGSVNPLPSSPTLSHRSLESSLRASPPKCHLPYCHSILAFAIQPVWWEPPHCSHFSPFPQPTVLQVSAPKSTLRSLCHPSLEHPVHFRVMPLITMEALTWGHLPFNSHLPTRIVTASGQRHTSFILFANFVRADKLSPNIYSHLLSQ